ncbi:hypothetical protein [Aneurinibacillus aneurinilyticus]|uniref:hypothetical protein n=1 Tax=Aneurinibacillus aneurinilyticus TaxID=1391 RepID=UPI0023F67D2C|nr:hypothetical protein [Aneurinibacillus aneurinilyticus]MCI1694257.1 hypothetical protein [Aneurinibacillus aneurinilyticus]
MTLGLFGSGIVGILLALLLQGTVFSSNGRLHGKLVAMEKNIWLQNPWRCGFVVFGFNAVLFAFVLAIVWGSIVTSATSGMLIPLFLYAPIAVAVSILGWLWIGRIRRHSFADRSKVALTGSSFYWLLTAVAWLRLQTLKPSFPGEDMFMAAIGFVFLLMITFVAAFLCTLLLGWPRRM